MQEKIEKYVLGALILEDDKEKQFEAISNLDVPGVFQNQTHYEIFSAMVKLVLSRKEITMMEVAKILQGNVNFEVLAGLTIDVHSSAQLPNMVASLLESKYKREIIREMENTLKKIKSGVMIDEFDNEKTKLIVSLSAMNMGDQAEFISLAEYKQKIREQLGSGRAIEGYSWGVQGLDSYTSGIIQSRVYVLGGLKKAGKTRFVIHTIKSLHNQGVQTAFLSMEMPAYENTKLLHSAFTGINDIRFRTGSILKHEEKIKFDEAEINEDLLAIECKSGLTKDQVLSRIRKYAKMGYKVCFIDYLQRIRHDRNKQAQELEDISIAIADSARQNNIAIVLLSQLNNTGEREAPNVGMLKGSGGIGESADSILLLDNLYRRSKDDADKNTFEIYLEQRYGDSGIVSLTGDLGTCTFHDLAKNNETI